MPREAALSLGRDAQARIGKNKGRGTAGAGSGRGGTEASLGPTSAGQPLGVALGPPGPFTSQFLLDQAEPLEMEDPGLLFFHLKQLVSPSPDGVAPALGHLERGDVSVTAAGRAVAGGW